MKLRGWLLVILCVSLIAALTGSASAQLITPEDMELNYSLAAGAGFFITDNLNSTTKLNLSFSWYDDAGYNFGNNSLAGMSLDWVQVERNDGCNVNLFPAFLNYRQYNIIGGYNVFVTFGIGTLIATDDIPEMQLDDGFNFGWTGGVGVDLSNNLFLQGRFIGGANPGDDGFVAVDVGWRF